MALNSQQMTILKTRKDNFCMSGFLLDPQLAADTIPIYDLPLCRVLLMNNRIFPWLILVPLRNGLRELFDLAPEDYSVAMSEVRLVSQKFAEITGADKMNVAALGNMVPQLHIHIIARFTHDAAWPQPVWGHAAKAQAYEVHELEKLKDAICSGLSVLP